MPETSPIPVKSLPGIKRDGTIFDGDQYVDGHWVRFDRGQPRKMGGYRAINRFLTGIPRTLLSFVKDEIVFLHAGSGRRLERMTIDRNFNTSLISDRTPLAGFVPDDDNIWDFAIDHTLDDPQIIAQVAPNLPSVVNTAGGALFTGPLYGTTPLVQVTNLPADYSLTGGVVSMYPYTMVFGNNGFVMWSVPGDPTDYTGSGAGNALVTHQKIVEAIPLRGGGASAPSALLWSADALIRMTFIGGTEAFAFDTISTETSILSQGCVIDYDGTFYWVGVDRFLMFNGVVREVENTLNKDFFFEGLNYNQRQKVFAYKVPRFGEIWWCFPLGDSEEPNHAVVFNVRENIWYDTPLPDGGRSAGQFPAVVRYPLMMGVAPRSYLMTQATVDDAGTGYVVGDVLTVVGGTFSVPAQVTVTAETGGVITAVEITNLGTYTVAPTSPVDTLGGTGTGATLDVLFEAPRALWVHEIGTDAVDGNTVRPVLSYFETADIALPPKGDNRATRVVLLEPDFKQTGDLTVQVMGRANARAPEQTGDPMTITEAAFTPDEEVVFLKDERRELRFRFTSNTLGGNYLGGLTLAHVGPGDGTVLG